MIKRKHDMRRKPRPEHRGWARVTWCGENPVFQYHISPFIVDSLLPNPLKIVLMGALRNELRINLHFPLIAHSCRSELRDSPEQPLQFTSLSILLQQLLPRLNPQLQYNFVLLNDRLVFARVPNTRLSLQSLLCKHILLANRSNDVRFAGEMWRDQNDRIVLNNKSGTYQPSTANVQQAVQLLQQLAPRLKIGGRSIDNSIF